MSSRSERDKSKNHDKHQAILSAMLKDEDNKYCVDCDAKGPRWASWNLGIFLCIRCAGIHRNLGVHISKVRSVNLDTWTGDQIAMMQEMGNSRARAVYEANLPDNFRRPQTDSGLEAFIRSKYEMKKYIAQEWVQPKPKFQPVLDEPPKKDKKKTRTRPLQLNNAPLPSSKTSSSTTSAKAESSKPTESAPAPAKPAPSVDLLGLDEPVSEKHTTSNDNLFGDFITNTGDAPTQNTTVPAGGNPSQIPPEGGTSNGLEDMNLFGESAKEQEKQKSTKESILALYGSSTNSTQMFGVPGGMYMPQQQIPQQQMPQQQIPQQQMPQQQMPQQQMPQQQMQIPPQQQQQQQQLWGAGMQNGLMGTNQAMAMGMQGNMGMMAAQGNNMMAGQQPEAANLMVVDPLSELQTNLYQQQWNGQPHVETNPFLQQYPPTQWNGQPYGGQMNNNMQPGMMMGMAGQSAGNMMPAGMMYNMPPTSMYGMPQQMQQMQNQMSAMGLGATSMGAVQQPGLVTAGGMGGNNWANQASGTTLSTNLWQ